MITLRDGSKSSIQMGVGKEDRCMLVAFNFSGDTGIAVMSFNSLVV